MYAINELTEVKKETNISKKEIERKLPMYTNETNAEEEKILVMAEDKVINIKEEKDDKLFVDYGERIAEEELHKKQNNDIIIKEEKEQLFVLTDNITKVGEELDIEYQKTDIKQEEGQLLMYDEISAVEEKLDTEDYKEITIKQKEDDLCQFTNEKKSMIGESNMKGVNKFNIKEEKQDSLIVQSRNSIYDSSKKVVILYHRPSQTLTTVPNADVKIAKTPAQLEHEYRARQQKEIQAAKEALLLLKRTKPGAKRMNEYKVRNRTKNLSTARQGCAEPSSAADISDGSMSTNKDNLTSNSIKKVSQAGRFGHVRGSAAVGGVRHTRWTEELNECVIRAYYEATEGETYFTSYRGRMLSSFQALQPALKMTEQRLSSQLWSIQQLQLVSESTLERLRNAVRTNLKGRTGRKLCRLRPYH